MANLITGLFDTESAAENAVSQLKQMGYTQNEISIIMKDRVAAAEIADTTGTRTMSDVGTGGVIGGIIGGVLGLIVAAGTVAIPGVGLIVAGPLAAMFAGAGAGGLAGSIIGWLAGAGIPEEVAPYYERGLQEGGIVVAVAAHPGDEERVRQVLQGGAVAYAGYNTPSYVAPAYASRYNDITPPARTYDTYGTTNEVQRAANSDAAEMRSAERTEGAHERAARREADDTNVIDRAATAVENTVDNTVTAVKNQSDKVATGTANTADRVTNP
jgi:hypothetical protein